MLGRYRDGVTATAAGPLSLTSAEAEERFALIDVERYDVAVDLRGLFEGEVLEATSTATFRCHQPGASTFVDCTGEITHATLNGVDLDPATATGGRLPLPDLQADNVLVVSSRQSDTSSGHGIQRTVDASDKLVYLWTTFEPDHARRAFANFDQPDLKAVHAFTDQRAGHLDGHQQLRAHGGRRPARRRPGLDASPTRRASRRTSRCSTPARSTRSASDAATTTSACTAASRSSTCSTATPRSCSS